MNAKKTDKPQYRRVLLKLSRQLFERFLAKPAG